MIIFFPAAFARLHTSSVAIIVAAMPLTGVSAFPATMLSTVCWRHGIPTFALIRSTTIPAVSAGVGVCAGTEIAAPARRNVRREQFIISPSIAFEGVGGSHSLT